MANPPIPKGTIMDFHGTKANGKGGTMPNPVNEYQALPMEPLDGSEWRPLDYPGIAPGYQVSLYGKVLSPRGNEVKPQLRKDKLIMALRQAGSTNSTSVPLAVLVLSTFDHYAPHLVPEHLDGDSTNCQATNLRWREPTDYEARGKKAAASARAAREKGRVRKSPSKPAQQPQQVPAVPRATPGVEMFRTYRSGGLEVLVTPAGEIPAKGLPHGKLSPAKVAALAEILKAVVEMNTFMGVEQ